MSKDILQQKALDILTNDKRLILQWATGVGKGYLAVKAFEKLKPEKSLLVVAETAHKDNWRAEFEKAGCSELLDKITIECYASLKNYKNSSWDFIVFDEAHHLGSELRLDILQSLKAERVLALSATLKNTELLDSLYSTFGKFKISSVDMQTAIESGYLPEPKVYLIPINLNSTNYNQEIIEEWGTKDKRITYHCTYKELWSYKKFKKTRFPHVRLVISCTEFQKYQYLEEQFSYWKKQYFALKNDRIKNMWLQYGTKRKLYLGQLKTEKVKKFLETIKDKKYICFCTNIEQAEYLGGENAIHSKKETDSKVIIDKFNNGSINNIFAVGMLQEGQNLSGIEAGVIVQLDGSERSFIQKFGRSLRAEDPIQYIFYYTGTRDEEYLQNVLENVDKRFIKTLTIC